jgi:hypothetical protein
MVNSCPTENGRMNNLAGADIAAFYAELGGAAVLMGSSGLAGSGDLAGIADLAGKAGLTGRLGFARSAGLTGSVGSAGNAGPPISIQALPKVAEAIAPAAVAVISELP